MTNFAQNMSYNGQVASDTERLLLPESQQKIPLGGSLVKSIVQEKQLRIQIDLKRKIMYKMANDYGFTHPYVVSCSQELDQLLNQYQKKVC